jgi:hypothetical protein
VSDDRIIDILFLIVYPPISAAIVYGGAYSAGRAVSGGQPVSETTKRMLRYGSLFIFGMGYIMGISKLLGHLSPLMLWLTFPFWGILVIAIARWRRQR